MCVCVCERERERQRGKPWHTAVVSALFPCLDGDQSVRPNVIQS